MKLYSRRLHRNVERQVHFGVGKSVRTACGLVLFSRHAVVGVFSDSDGALITDDLNRVTCKRCLATRENRLRKILAVESSCPGILDHDTLCGEQWLLDHALDVSAATVNAQRLQMNVGGQTICLVAGMKSKDRKELLRGLRG